LDEGEVTIGITDHAQDALGEVVFVDLPETGAKYGQKVGKILHLSISAC